MKHVPFQTLRIQINKLCIPLMRSELCILKKELTKIWKKYKQRLFLNRNEFETVIIDFQHSMFGAWNFKMRIFV